MTGEWLGVEIRHLVALSVVARQGSFRSAADELGYVQSAVSQQISQLERLVGCRLLDRSRGMRGCAPTPAGEVLLAHVDHIVARYEAAQADITALRDGADGVLRVGMVGSVAARLLPGIIIRLQHSAPGVRIEPTEAANEADLFPLVEHGDLDVAFAAMPLEPGPFDCCRVGTERLVLVVQADSPLARSVEPPSIDEIIRLPLIAVGNVRPGTGVEDSIRAQGSRPRIVQTVDSAPMAQALVAAGVGVAVLPRFAVDLHDRRTAVVALGSAVPARGLMAYWHSERTAMTGLREFCIAASATAREFADSGDPPPNSPAQLALARAA